MAMTENRPPARHESKSLPSAAIVAWESREAAHPDGRKPRREAPLKRLTDTL
jgi:hypothetical protein